jgi:GTPase SAR1 family protein
MNIDHILEDLPEMDPAASILLRGDHGIGKSSLVRQLTRRIKEKEGRKDYPIIDRRLSQMTQGDIIGLPIISDDRTRYMPPDWYKMACERPVVLFLDELNRAEVEVMQAAFQIVLDRELNGHRLHPETRVYSAVNTGATYNVNQMDPALLDRFFVVDVNFTLEEWVKWAKTDGGLTIEVIDFVIRNPTWLTTPKKFNPGSVMPSPRSWEFADKNIRSLIVEGRTTNVYDLAKIRRRMSGYLGVDAAMCFVEDLNSQFRFSGADIMERYSEIRDLIRRDRIDVMVSAVEKVDSYCSGINAVNEIQAANLKLFIWDLEKDHRVTLWQRLAKGGNARLTFIKSIHQSVAEAICDSFGVPVGPKGIGILPGVHGAVVRADEEKVSA